MSKRKPRRKRIASLADQVAARLAHLLAFTGIAFLSQGLQWIAKEGGEA